MGEISEMMLDGTLCSQCGVFLVPEDEGEAGGYPRSCSGCQSESDSGYLQEQNG